MTNGQENTGDDLRPKPTRSPILLSALVWPGVGQFVQKRWVAGTVYSLAFLLCFVLSFVYAGKIMVMYYGLWDAEEANTTQVEPMLFKMIFFFGVAIVVFITNLVDTYVAHQRIAHEWSRKNAGRRTGIA